MPSSSVSQYIYASINPAGTVDAGKVFAVRWGNAVPPTTAFEVAESGQVTVTGDISNTGRPLFWDINTADGALVKFKDSTAERGSFVYVSSGDAYAGVETESSADTNMALKSQKNVILIPDISGDPSDPDPAVRVRSGSTTAYVEFDTRGQAFWYNSSTDVGAQMYANLSAEAKTQVKVGTPKRGVVELNRGVPNLAYIPYVQLGAINGRKFFLFVTSTNKLKVVANNPPLDDESVGVVVGNQ